MIAELVQEQRDYFLSGKTWSLEGRKAALERLYQLLLKYRKRFDEAFIADYNKCEFDVLSTEYYLVLEECEYHIKHLKKEVKAKRVKTSIVNFPSHGRNALRSD